MGRPKVPLIDRDEAVTTALELIDDEGLDAFSIRRLGHELGVNGASLYHHFKDKDEILHGVRMLVLQEARVIPPRSKTATWRDYALTAAARYRAALLRHPNTAPLMVPGQMRQIGVGARDHLVATMIEAGVPLRLAYPIIDSVETLAFGSALLNPRQVTPAERFSLENRRDAPNLRQAIRSSYRSPERLFRFELQTLLDGWTAVIDRNPAGT